MYPDELRGKILAWERMFTDTREYLDVHESGEKDEVLVYTIKVDSPLSDLRYVTPDEDPETEVPDG